MTSESDRLLAAGIPVTLNNGVTVNLRYGMRGMKALEDRFDTFSNVLDTLAKLSDKTKLAGPLVDIMEAGLLHPASGFDQLDADGHPTELIDLLEFREVKVYLRAIDDALTQAMPPGEPGKASSSPTPSRSRGARGTTSPPLSSVDATGTSG